MVLPQLFLVAGCYLISPVTAALQVPLSFENTAVVRTIELGGSEVHVTTSYTTRSLGKENNVYYFVVPKKEDDKTSWVDVKIKGQSSPLLVEKHGIDALLHKSQPVIYYSVDLPKWLNINESVTLLVNTIESHASIPLPATAKQNDPQSLLYETGAYVQSPYTTVNQRTKIRSPSPTIHSYSDPPSLSRFAVNAPVTKSGASVTYGPFKDIPPSDDGGFSDEIQETVKVHYQYEKPLVTVALLRRAAEISHWGSNLNIQDNIHLRNDGPRLDGHFSRLQFQQQAYQRAVGNHVLGSFTIRLPPDVRDPYYTDIVGNVSTSRFRPAPPKVKSRASERFSSLDVRPRYPLLGGWNYSFTLGWDTPLENSAVYDKSQNKYTIRSVVDDAEVKVILPEGARADIQIYTPFAMDSIARDTHITFLDTKGRPSITLSKRNLTEKHTSPIYVTYTVSLSAHFSKVVAVSSAAFLLFSLMFVVRRVDTTIRSNTQK
ncbi:hypothetical protein BS47DRAFT_1376772 [Hydnum rufescens UP504]|uniref:Dolichyl-diphosphooligosaccharide--protein glycosyltransferase subunit 1 n=1 Tax=Hydnum rufescens UP504 TaxID=1448309 RepID=A0A9P6AWE5_9AGAM|nr:hypothetical protein BS47DRAFT_1376772 [Hydnum rufescens UP504]